MSTTMPAPVTPVLSIATQGRRPHYNPWAHASYLGIPIVYTEGLHEGVWGLTDGRQIWLENVALARELRATLAHELVHVELGHCTPQDEETEAMVTLIAARRLVDDKALRWALKQSADVERLAELLDVDEPTVEALLGEVA